MSEFYFEGLTSLYISWLLYSEGNSDTDILPYSLYSIDTSGNLPCHGWCNGSNGYHYNFSNSFHRNII